MVEGFRVQTCSKQALLPRHQEKELRQDIAYKRMMEAEKTPKKIAEKLQKDYDEKEAEESSYYLSDDYTEFVA